MDGWRDEPFDRSAVVTMLSCVQETLNTISGIIIIIIIIIILWGELEPLAGGLRV